MAETKPITISKRMGLCFFWTVFGLVFFYLVMVGLSSITDNIILEAMEPIGWPRVASRHTAAVTAPVFTLFLLSSPASLWSLFLAVMAACAQFCHFVILSSDLSVYSDDKIAKRVFRIDPMHPIFQRLPLYTAHVVGSIGFIAFLVITSERCFGHALRTRRLSLPLSSRLASAWISGVFALWFGDRLLFAVQSGAPREQVMYPLVFLLPLLAAQIVSWRRARAAIVAIAPVPIEKKSN